MDYEELSSKNTLIDLDPDSALDHLGALIDLSTDLEKQEGLEISIVLSQELIENNLIKNKKDLCILHYFIGNAWNSLKKIKFNENWENIKWESEETEREILHLRIALNGDGFNDLNINRKCQILTNLGNAMDEIGRFVEAIEYWNKALEIDDSFAMAIGNIGEGLGNYARYLYDRRHSIALLDNARSYIDTALKAQLDKTSEAHFRNYKKEIDSKNLQKCIECVRKDAESNECSMGDSEEEIKYRRWCFENKLFLNPLNDLGQFSKMAIADVISTPTIRYKIDQGPYYSGYFNQLKQEYISARYLYYEGIYKKELHFSDKNVYLVDTFDYPAYSIAIEKVKIAFRTNYSIFDKISYFLNDYLKLSIKERSVNFKTLWYNSQDKKKGLRKEFESNDNWPLRGLFWISKDLFEIRSDFMLAMEPEAQKLYEVRNHIEHKYFKLHNKKNMPEYKTSSGLIDPLAFSMPRQEFEDKTLRLIKTIRAAIIYLSSAIQHEEKRRLKLRPEENACIELHACEFYDEWKI